MKTRFAKTMSTMSGCFAVSIVGIASILTPKIDRKAYKYINTYLFNMNQKLTAIVYKSEKYFVAECPEIGTASQGKTKKEAIENLKEATELYLEVCHEKRFSNPSIIPFKVSLHGKITNAVGF